MGLFDNIKKILFEDDDEDEIKGMPVYTDKEEVKEIVEEKIVTESVPEVDDIIKTNDNSHFKNVKRDIDLSFDESEVIEEVVNKVEPSKPEAEMPLVLDMPAKKEEKKSVFLSFDEDEFDRLNSRVNRNEARVRQDIKANTVPNVEARKANNNFSSTSTSRDNRVDNDRYRISSTPVKKTFTPSPIISPVYGILDKNYTKDDIVDKKDGLKREKIIKPVVKKEPVKTVGDAEKELEMVQEKETIVEKNVGVVDIDSVRKKAYGELEDLEKTLTDLKLPNLNEVKVIDSEPAEEIVDIYETKEIDTSVEDELDTKFSVEDIALDTDEKELDQVVDEVIDSKNDEKTKVKPQLLDDLEKTSTLQILDDIEKELNSIKPITKDVDSNDDYEEKIKKDDTLEKDLFNLIDSMYEEGEEDEDND